MTTSNTNRPSWDEYFMKIAEDVSSRSTCIRRHVGAVIVKDKMILSTGYNGAPAGCDHCDSIGCMRELLKVPSGQRHELCRAGHAETNAIAQAARHGVPVEGATCYCTTAPCSMCAKSLINAGIKRIVSGLNYPDPLATDLFSEAGVVFESLKGVADTPHG